MNAQEYIKKVNFMVNAGTDFDYKEAYKTLSKEDQATVDAYFDNKTFTATF
jgi:hypothetical protein